MAEGVYLSNPNDPLGLRPGGREKVDVPMKHNKPRPAGKQAK